MTKRKVFGISKHLNEGISQTINAVKNNAGQLRYEVVPLSKIQLDPENPRKLAISFADVMPQGEILPTDPLFERKRKELESLQSLANSIKKQGVRHAIEVYKDGSDYRLISGERRVLASWLAGREDIQARILDTRPSELDIRYLQWIENIEREDLRISERISNVKQLIAAYNPKEGTMTATQLKELLGCSLPHAMTYLAIVDAPDDVQALITADLLTNLEKAALLAKVTDTKARTTLIQACVEKGASLAQLKKLVQSLSAPAPAVTFKSSKQGRQAKRVTLGYTFKLPVAKKLIEFMLQDLGPSHPRIGALEVDWDDFATVSNAFSHLIKVMEDES